MKLKDSVVLITGGTLGIGKATAKLLIEQGAKVAITGRNKGRLEAAANELRAFGVVADVSSPSDVERTFKEVLAKFGRLDGLVNNAAYGGRKLLLEVEPDEFQKMWQTNVLGATLMAQGAAKIFIAQKSKGNIVNIASTAGLRGFEGGTMYASSKFALRGMTECWRAELRKHDIRVILVNPSEVTTGFGRSDGTERPEEPSKLTSREIAHAIKASLEMDDRGFVAELTVFATNPV